VNVTKDRDSLRRKTNNLERELEAFSAVATMTTFNTTQGELSKPSKAKRAVLAARAAGAPGGNVEATAAAGAGGKKAGITIPKPWKQKHLHGGAPQQYPRDNDAEDDGGVTEHDENDVDHEDKENSANITGTSFFVGI
jgi:hypothetical protein